MKVGIDCCRVDRFRKSEIDSNSFYKKLFTQEEILYCQSRKFPEQHFAARFATKEAIIKALSSFDANIRFLEIEILKKEDNAPYAVINNEKIEQRNIKVDISITHCDDLAIAVAIAYDCTP